MSSPATPPLRRRPRGRARPTRYVAATLAAVMVATLAPQVPALAQPPREVTAPERERDEIPSVEVRQVTGTPQPTEAAPATAADKPAPVWPTPGSAVAVVPGAPAGPVPGGGLVPDAGMAEPAQTVQAGGLPVTADRPSGAADSPGQVRVEVLDRKATAQAGVRGVIVRATPRDVAGAPVDEAGPVRFTVDYRAFATGYGADWTSRLRLVALPECALTDPGSRDCVGEPLPTRNNLTARLLTATVDFDDGAGLLAVQAAPSGPTGDYSATSLQPSSTWSAGGNSGGFTWSYPMRVPPGVGGPTPEVALSYSSQSVDGRHAASNNQPSWVGEGFEAWPGGFIERSYKTCADDMDGSANNSEETGDQCWATDNAVMSLNGVSGELLYNSSEQRWHLRSDDGSRIERKTGANNGDNNGEYWVVTATDGTQYWFGKHRLPGWSSGDPVTHSTWTTPVFGNHPGEPCHASAFDDSDCTQAWRWNLDYVVDIHGNSISYWYTKETNKYARNLDPADDTSYVRGGYLDHIAYGTRRSSGTDSVFNSDPPAKVVFEVDDRCLSSCGTEDETHWPDTPWDQECTGSTCDTYAPTYWTTKRLASVTTQVWGGSSYRDVERWTFTHSFPDPGDTTRAGLWLDSITHEGLVGGTESVPDVEFTPVSLDNRVDEIDHSPAMAWHRIARIDTETGGALAVTYSDRDCESSKPTPHTNTRRCYPVYWAPEGETDPVQDWFHKYVVTELREVDMVGGQPEVIHRYDYLGGAAWRYTDDNGLVDEETKTWSQWRGYGRVTVTTGEGDTEQEFTETRYFRGMDGDKLPSGTRDVDVTDSQSGTWPDRDWFAGMVREEIVFDGPGGAEVSGEIRDPWASSPTASRTINGSTVDARITNVETSRARTVLDGGRGYRTTKVTTTFDSLGMPVAVDDFGEDGVSGDERCTKLTYSPRNDSAWLMEPVHRSQKFAVDCATADTPASLNEDDVISDVRTSFDGNTYGTAPSRGLPTTIEELSDWDAGTPSYVTVEENTYDVHGRVLEARDALDRPTTTSYEPTTGGPVTEQTVTNALGHESTSFLEPAFGVPTRKVDPNGKETELAYDPLGRLTDVWLPGRDAATETANYTFDYGVRDDDVTYVTTRRLNPSENYVASHSLFDGLLREVQTQQPSPSGGRILTNTFYDNAGRAFQTYDHYYNSATMSTDLYVPVEPFDIPTQLRTLFDGAGRKTAEVFRPYNEERWRTSYAYGGDRTDVTPPAGGTATSTATDARGNTVELRQYHAPTPTGSYDQTSYDYDRKGQLVGVTGPAGNEWEYVYDLRGRTIEAHDPDAGETRLEYDDADQLTGVIDGRVEDRVVYTYDELGRRTHMYRYLPFGTPLAVWVYDTKAKGQLDQSVRFEGGQPYRVEVRGYTDHYQPTGIDVVIPSAETGLGGTYTTEYTYHVDGSVDTMAWSTTADVDLPNEGVYYQYDDVLGLPTRLEGYLEEPLTYVTSTLYNALGQVDQLTMRTDEQADAVRLGYQRELETGRLTDSWVDMDTAPYVVADAHYDYDPAGNITRIGDQSPAGDDTQCFEHDYLRRLTQAWTPDSGDCAEEPTTGGLGGPAPYWLSWSYDLAGNRLSQTEHATGGDVVTSYDYPPAGGPQPHTLISATTTGQGTVNWTYDAAGNTLTRPDGAGGQQSLEWDVEGRLESVTDSEGTTDYLYDADGNRLIARDPEGKTLWLPGQEVRWDEASDTLKCTRYYEYGGQTIASRDVGGLTWLASDHQGTAQAAITEQGQAVDLRRQTPFGEPRGTVPDWPNRQGFVGGANDPTGLTHLGAREYDPEIGRFISVDPIMDLTDPQQIHGYAYANNSPVTMSDPSGLMGVKSIAVAGGGFSNGPSIGNHGDTACVDSCGSDADNYVRTAAGEQSQGRGGTTGPVEIGAPGITHDDAARAIYKTNYGSLSAEERGHVDWYVWSRNNPDAHRALLDALGGGEFGDNDEYGWGNELLGIADAHRCFIKGSAEGCAWLLTAIPPLKGLKLPKWVKAAWANRAAKYCSFSGDTEVLMADGTTKPISEIEPGDKVLATDPETGNTSAQTVTDVWVHEDTLVDLQVLQPNVANAGTLSSTTDGMKVVTVTTTSDHPFWNAADQRWQPAGTLTPADRLLAADDTTPEVVGLAERTRTRGQAYNLTVASLHTYYVMVGDTPVVVHNTCPNWSPKSRPTFGHTFSRHGAGAKNTRSLIDRARSTGRAQGQWLDNDAAADFLKNSHMPDSVPRSVAIPEGLGQVIMPDGSVVPATRAILVPSSNGLYKTAYPVPDL